MHFSISKASQRQITSCIAIILCDFLGGCRMGWFEATTPMFLAPNSSFDVTPRDVAWISSASSCGTVVTIIIFLLFTRNKGRKKVITGGIIMYGNMWLILTTAKSTIVIGICCFSIGVTKIFLDDMNSVYVGEIATPKTREILSVMRNTAFGVGKGFIFALSLLDNYFILSFVPFVVSVIAFAFSFWIRETPYYLISQNLNDLGKSTLCWLRGENTYELVEQEFEDMRKYVEEKDELGLFSSFKKAKNIKSILFYMIIFGIGYVNCNSVILVYGPEFIKNLKSVNGNIFMNIYSVIHIMCFALSFFTVKNLSRRDLLFYGFVITFILHALCGLFFFIEERSNVYIDAIGVVAAILLVTYMIVQILTISAGIEVLKTEVYAFQVKEFCEFISSIISELFQFFILQVYFPLRGEFGDSANFVVYSLFSIFGFLSVHFFMRDTKNKTLLQIQNEHNSYGLFVRT